MSYLDRNYPPIVMNFFDAFNSFWEALPKFIIIDIFDLDINFMNLNSVELETERKYNDSYIIKN